MDRVVILRSDRQVQKTVSKRGYEFEAFQCTVPLKQVDDENSQNRATVSEITKRCKSLGENDMVIQRLRCVSAALTESRCASIVAGSSCGSRNRPATRSNRPKNMLVGSTAHLHVIKRTQKCIAMSSTRKKRQR